MTPIFTDYIKYRATLRGFNLVKIESILRYSQEKYFDIETQRKIIIGKHDDNLVMIPYEIKEGNIVPVTIVNADRHPELFAAG